jgi:copper chaperone CopZ
MGDGQQVLESVPGVVRALVDLEGGRAEIEAGGNVGPAHLAAVVEQAGYDARPA